MNATPTTDPVHDPVDRLLRTTAERWREGQDEPSYDAVLARAVASRPAREPDLRSSGSHASRWRALGVAAAVLVLVGGIVGAVALSRGGHDRVTASGPSTSTSTDAPGPASGPRLTRLPAGFVAAAPVLTPGSPTPVAYYESPRVSAWGSHESISVVLGAGAPVRAVPAETAPVRGHEADVVSFTCDVASSTCLSITVTWAEDADRWVQVAYRDDSQEGAPLTTADVVAAADSFEPGTGAWTVSTPAPTSTSPSALPATVDYRGQTLVLWGRDPLTWSDSAPDPRYALPVSLRREPDHTPDYCSPYAVPVLTAASPDRVEVTVGLYVDVVPEQSQRHPCPAPLPRTRTTTVLLDGPLAGRQVVDGSTGRAVPPTP